MNQRIFELAEQALEETYRVMGSKSLQEAFDDFYTEKFAELIVRECADVAKETRWAVPPSQEQIARGIQQHFGVEE